MFTIEIKRENFVSFAYLFSIFVFFPNGFYVVSFRGGTYLNFQYRKGFYGREGHEGTGLVLNEKKQEKFQRGPSQIKITGFYVVRYSTEMPNTS